jgi:hypothetical protein
MTTTTNPAPGPSEKGGGPSMHKVAIVIYSGLEGSGISAVYRAFGFAAELLEAGDDVTLVFDGTGTETLAAVMAEGHDLHRAWLKARPALRGACSYCAKSYGVREALVAAEVPMLTEDRNHASLRGLLNEGRQIVTF